MNTQVLKTAGYVDEHSLQSIEYTDEYSILKLNEYTDEYTNAMYAGMKTWIWILERNEYTNEYSNTTHYVDTWGIPTKNSEYSVNTQMNTQY